MCYVLLGVCCLMQCFAGSRLLWVDLCIFFCDCFVVAVVACYLLLVVCGGLCVLFVCIWSVLLVVGLGALCVVVAYFVDV